MQSFLKIQANQRHQIRTVEKFLDFLEVFQRFKPAGVRSCWGTDSEDAGLIWTLQSIPKYPMLGYCPCLPLENQWSVPPAPQLVLPGTVWDGYRTRPPPQVITEPIPWFFPQCFILLQKRTGRMKEQTADVQPLAQKGSWLWIPAIQCQSSLPCLTRLQSAPMWRCFREATMGTVPEHKKQNKTQNNFSVTLPFKNFAVCLVLSKWHPCTLAGLQPTAFNQTLIHPKE